MAPERRSLPKRPPPRRYIDVVLENLSALRAVAVFHPRMALVGIDSELESVVRECFPQTFLDVEIASLREDRRQRNRYPSRPQSDDKLLSNVVSSQLLRLARRDDIPTDVRSFIEGFRDIAGRARHSRSTASIGTILNSITNAVKCMEWLCTAKALGAFSCSGCAIVLTFSLENVLTASIGSVIPFACPECSQPHPLTVANPSNRAETVLPAAVLETLHHELVRVAVRAWLHGQIGPAEMLACRMALIAAHTELIAMLKDRT